MNIFNNKIFKPRSARQIAVCSIIVFAVAVPATSFAAGGYWSQNRGITKVRAKVQKVSKKAVKKVADAPAKAQETMQDLVDKLNEIYSQIEENRPLLNQMKGSPLMSGVTDTMKFLQDNQTEFKQFVAQDADYFRDDVKNLMLDFIGISQDFPIARQKAKVVESMQQIVTLIDRLPPALLYPMYKALGPRLEEMQAIITSIRTKLAAIPKLPPLKDLYLDPMAHAETMCTFVTDKEVAVHVATLQATIKSAIFITKMAKEYIPKDFSISVTVVGGGGLTLMVHPARIPFIAIGNILEGIDLAITNTSTIGTSVCTASGLHTPS